MADPGATDDDPSPVTAMIDAMDAVVAAELALLRAEADMLAALLPRVPRPEPGATPADDGEIEDNFDNMPV